MKREVLNSVCPILKDFLVYSESIKGISSGTVEQYCFDLTLLFKFLKIQHGIIPDDADFDEIDTKDIDAEFLHSVTITDLYSFLVFCKNERSNNAATRSRKVSSLRSFFNYLTNKINLLSVNPAAELTTPKQRKSLPIHLTLEESLDLLKAVDGQNKERDFCIITLFLNCGMRLSELCSINYTDIKPDGSLKILGKGNKERIIYLNDACISAITDYMKVRPNDKVLAKDKTALFLSGRHRRISNKTVQHIVKTTLARAGLEGQGYSTHKLRHTAATLMYQDGGVDIRILKEVLGHANLGTTQIYTHVSDSQVEKAFKSNPLAEFKNK
jgi:site-specific recombinase XerD